MSYEEGAGGFGRPNPCITPLVPELIQVEELGCLELEAEAKMENCQAAVPGQPSVLVSRVSALGLSVWVLGSRGLLLPR